MVESKSWLEAILGKKVGTFCYPFGDYNEEISFIAKKVGFKGARTTERFIINSPKNFFTFGTTINVYPQPFRKKNENHYFGRYLLQPFLQTYSGAKKMGIPTYKMLRWKTMAISAFDITLARGEVFHLWGHSWEIDKYGMWDELENLLKYISFKKNCEYLTNGQVVKINQNENFISTRRLSS